MISLIYQSQMTIEVILLIISESSFRSTFLFWLHKISIYYQLTMY